MGEWTAGAPAVSINLKMDQKGHKMDQKGLTIYELVLVPKIPAF